MLFTAGDDELQWMYALFIEGQSMPRSLRLLGFPLWYFLPVMIGSVLFTLPNLVLISGYPETKNSGDFLLCLHSCTIFWLIAVSVRHTRDEEGNVTNLSLVKRLGVLFGLFIPAFLALALYGHVNYEYPLVRRPQEEGGTLSIQGVSAGFTHEQVVEAWGAPDWESPKTMMYYPPNRRTITLLRGVATHVAGTPLEVDGTPVLGMGANLEAIEKVLGPGIDPGNQGRAFRRYPLRGLDAIASDFRNPFQSEFTIVRPKPKKNSSKPKNGS